MPTLNPNIRDDCADGTCYEGACAGDSVYTTTGECGAQNGYRLCAGVWGDCCNAAGQCGSGDDFCAFGVCQLGNCTIPVVVPSLPSWVNGNTTDGTCGGRTPSLAIACMETAATRMGSAEHFHQIVEQDGEFRAFFPTSYPHISLLLSRDAIFDLRSSQSQ
jgi:hypothetical protein